MPDIQGTRTTVIDPAGAMLRLWEKLKERPERRKTRCPYAPAPAWETKLRSALGNPPENSGTEAEAIWPRVNRQSTEHGIQPGPYSYLKHNDGNPAFMRATVLLARSLPARMAIETDVAQGGDQPLRTVTRLCPFHGPVRLGTDPEGWL